MKSKSIPRGRVDLLARSSILTWLVPSLLTCVAMGAAVTNCTETDLRAAMAAGGTVAFACDGTITLTNTITNTLDTVLDGSGHQVTISGGGVPAVGIFYVPSNRLSLVNLTLADGSSTFGGAIFNDGGAITLLGTTVRDNHALQEPFMPPTYFLRGGNGGAIYNINSGSLIATNCLFSHNVAGQQGGGSLEMWTPTDPCHGGAIDNEAGQVTLHQCAFVGNLVQGGSGWIITRQGQAVGGTGGRSGCGGAIYSWGTLNATQCSFEQNTASGGPAAPQPYTGLYPSSPTGAPGSSGGNGQGGAIYNAGTATITASLFFRNSAGGGGGGAAGPGESAVHLPWEVCGDGGVGGQGGDGLGGSLFDGGTTAIINCTFVSNSATGGPGGNGGMGGAVNVRYPCAGAGGSGGRGGAGIAAICSSGGGPALTNCTIAANASMPGVGGGGGPGGVAGPSVGPNGLPGSNGQAGPALNLGNLCNTLLASNSPANGSGALNDLGHNLASDTSCAFTNLGSMNNLDPMLGPLADNGGPTLTLALLPGSPAIDHASSASTPATDQRDFPRPVGVAADIGAFEFGSPAFLRATRSSTGGLDILVTTIPAASVRLEASADLSDWAPIATNQVTPAGTVLFSQPIGGAARSFYRVALP